VHSISGTASTGSPRLPAIDVLHACHTKVTKARYGITVGRSVSPSNDKPSRVSPPCRYHHSVVLFDTKGSVLMVSPIGRLTIDAAIHRTGDDR
jgi:hypothetical protein